MHSIVRVEDGSIEEQVRRVASARHQAGRRLPEYFLSPQLVDRPPCHVDGFLVMGSRCVPTGRLCVVSRTSERPGVRFEESLVPAGVLPGGRAA